MTGETIVSKAFSTGSSVGMAFLTAVAAAHSVSGFSNQARELSVVSTAIGCHSLANSCDCDQCEALVGGTSPASTESVVSRQRRNKLKHNWSSIG
ncbi:hypothetical protein TYRP_015779 [Tyrophagus putrescentiae]|nr:hypothetical protein TYRP_015779 [Tyrophagus putrescentiae]